VVESGGFLQRVATYRTGPEGKSSANDNAVPETVSQEAARGVLEIEAFLAEVASPVLAIA
jgi:hypothetical protein